MMWASHMTMLGSSAEVVVQMDDKSSSSCLTQSRRGLGLVCPQDAKAHQRYHDNRRSASTRERITCFVNTLFTLSSTVTPFCHCCTNCCVCLCVGLREAPDFTFSAFLRIKTNLPLDFFRLTIYHHQELLGPDGDWKYVQLFARSSRLICCLLITLVIGWNIPCRNLVVSMTSCDCFTRYQ